MLGQRNSSGRLIEVENKLKLRNPTYAPHNSQKNSAILASPK